MASSSSFSRLAALGFASAVAGLVFLAACSSSTTPSCDSSKCAAHNKCLPLNGDTQCRRTCSSNTDPANNCPFGYTCVNETPEPFCVANTGTIKPSAKGGWGAPCVAANGFDTNPDCDTAQQFLCYGVSPTDADAYCTQYSCTTDRDCAATFYCGKANVAPNVTTTQRTIGQTNTVCLKRNYCAPCTVDFDCPTFDNKPQHCLPSRDGTASFCAPECASSDNCNLEASCVDVGGYKACYPRAGACVGDGSLCSPCLSDGDCGDDGACVKGQYTTEHACAKKLTSGTCTQGAKPDCPPQYAGSKAGTSCTTDNTPEAPAGYCIGVYNFGSGGDIGCFTPTR
jgi:hypothetical protein